MHRALGGALTSRVHWRSLGRSLLANAMRVRRSWCCSRVGAAQAASVLTGTLLQIKNKIFLGFVRYAAITPRIQLWKRHCCASPEQHFRTKASGVGVVRARPPHNNPCSRKILPLGLKKEQTFKSKMWINMLLRFCRPKYNIVIQYCQ